MIELRKKEIQLLLYAYALRSDVFYVSKAARKLDVPQTTVWALSQSLSRKGLLEESDRSRTKPLRLSALGRAYAWLAQLQPKQMVALVKEYSNKISSSGAGDSRVFQSGT